MGEECISVKIASFGIASVKEKKELGQGTCSTFDLAALASEKCLTNIPEDEKKSIEAIILATGLPDNFGTSTSTLIKRKLALNHCACHDLTAGDAGFLYALQLGAVYISTGKCNYVLVIAAETPSMVFRNQKHIGIETEDIAGAVLLKKTNEDIGFCSFEIGSKYGNNEIVKYPVGGSRFPISFNAVMRDECKIEVDMVVKRKNTINSLVKILRAKKIQFNFDVNVKIIFPKYLDVKSIVQIMKESDLPIELAVMADGAGYSGSAGIAYAFGDFMNKSIQQEVTYVLVVAGSSFSYGVTVYKIRE